MLVLTHVGPLLNIELLVDTLAIRTVNGVESQWIPSGDRVQATATFEPDTSATGWNAPATAPWLSHALDQASDALWSKPAAYMGEGGTIPFMGMLNVKFPQAQLLVTGVLGPKAHAHGPNEFIDIAYSKKVTTATAMVIAALP